MASEIKLVLVGVGGVGKSAVTITYVSNVWVPEYDPTIEDSHRKQVSIDDEASMLDILDTAGQEEYSSMQDQWFRTGAGFLIVYSVINRKSFREVKPLRDKIHRIKDRKDVPMVLVGNKVDLADDRVVTEEEGKQQGVEFNCPYFETSAKTHTGVDEAFTELVREVRKWERRKQTEMSSSKGSGKAKSPGVKKPGGCYLL